MTDFETEDQLSMASETLETPAPDVAEAPEAAEKPAKPRKRAAKAAQAEKNMTFEEALAGLEALVQQLEQGELPLEESMRLYEQGVRLTAFCNRQLRDAKLRIEELKKTQDEE